MRIIKCKSKNVLEVLKYIRSSNLVSQTDEAWRAKYILKLLEQFYFYILYFLYVRRMW